MKKILHYTLKVLKISLIVIVLVYAAAYIYITLNKKNSINQIIRKISNRINADVIIKNADSSFIIEELYSQVGNTDISIEVPLSALF